MCIKFETVRKNCAELRKIFRGPKRPSMCRLFASKLLPSFSNTQLDASRNQAPDDPPLSITQKLDR